MNVVVAGYQAVSILHGGPNTQITNTIKHLHQFGVSVKRFDAWSDFKKEECDLFHVFAANIGTFHLTREIHALGIPLVVSPITYSLHSHAFVRTTLVGTRFLQKFGKGFWSDYQLTSDMCGWAQRVAPNTGAEGDLLVNGLGVDRAKIRVIPNGVDRRFAEGDPSHFQKAYGLDKFILNVGHTGHVRKNVLSLIRALGKIDHPAVIIGRIIKGAYGDACVREAEKFPHIRLIDGMENNSAMLASAYAACDVFVLPSLFETPGIAALEAGLAGAKVVITGEGGTREYFGDRADYCDPRSVESIRAAICRGLERKKDPALRLHIEREFLWERVAEKTAGMYRELH